MEIGKKGIFFTTIALLIITLFIISYTFYSVVEDTSSTEKRIESLNSFVFATQTDIERQIYISGFRSLFLIQKRITETGQYESDLNGSVTELFLYGTLENQTQEVMSGARFSDIQNVLQEKANKINANVSLQNPSLSISQDDPWNVKFSLTADLFIEDLGNLVSWNKTITSVSYVPIESFEDPFYIIGTSGQLTNNIRETNVTSFTNGTDVTNLNYHSTESFYINSTDSPSYLSRLQGIFTGDSNGIESIVNLQELSAQGISIQQKSVVDHIYFSNSNPSSFRIQGTPSWFRLDSAHLDVYEVSGLTL